MSSTVPISLVGLKKMVKLEEIDGLGGVDESELAAFSNSNFSNPLTNVNPAAAINTLNSDDRIFLG